MIRIDAKRGPRTCDGLTRRDFFHAGSLPLMGLSLSQIQAAEKVQKSSDMNCILLFLVGGPSQIDTFDPKPSAPAEIRGPFQPIKTNVPGIQISEIFPRLAGMMDKVSLVRSVYHQATAVHDTGYQMMQTGRLFGPGLEHPHYGSILSYVKGPKGDAPPYVLLPKPIGATGGNLPHGHTAGYLGKTHDPFILNADPNSPNFKVPDLLPPEYITAARTERRRSLRNAIDANLASFEASADAKLLDSNFQQAYSIMSSAKTREAFDLKNEKDAIRDRYGRTRFGQSCLMARRLVEAGVRLVTVNMFETVFNEVTWDIHGSSPFTSIEGMKKEVAPNFDQAYTALIEDLHLRGMLQNTMILAFGEFGRTPKVNPAGGRDHHPGVWTSLFAGGPFKGGTVVGESDEIGGSPKTRPVTTGEIAATVYSGLGLSLDTELRGPGNRPIRLVDHGIEPIQELLV
jgi:uncharacterized protein (DUF1501 family)